MNSTDGFNGMLITLKKRISCISQDDTRDYQYMMFGHYDGMDIHCTREWYQLRPKGVCERAGNIIIGDTFQDKYTLKLYMPEPEVREYLEKQGFAYNIWEQMGYRDSNDSCVELLKRYPFISVSVINLSKQFVAGREKLLDKITASIKDAADKRAIPVEEVHCAVMPSIGYADFTLLFLSDNPQKVIDILDILRETQVIEGDRNYPVLSNSYAITGFAKEGLQNLDKLILDNVKLSIRVNLREGVSAGQFQKYFDAELEKICIAQNPGKIEKQSELYQMFGNSDCLILSDMPFGLFIPLFYDSKLFNPGNERFPEYIRNLCSSIRVGVEKKVYFEVPESGIDSAYEEYQREFVDLIEGLTELVEEYGKPIRLVNGLQTVMKNFLGLIRESHCFDIQEIIGSAFKAMVCNMKRTMKMLAEAEDIEVKEILVERLLSAVGIFRENIGDYLADMQRSDRSFIEGQSLSHPSIGSATKLLFFYNQYINETAQMLMETKSGGNAGQEETYTFVIMSGGCDVTTASDIFSYMDPADEEGHSLIIITVPEMSLYDIKGTMFRILHECLHFCGERKREERFGHLIRSFSSYSAWVLSNGLKTSLTEHMRKTVFYALENRFSPMEWEEVKKKSLEFVWRRKEEIKTELIEEMCRKMEEASEGWEEFAFFGSNLQTVMGELGREEVFQSIERKTGNSFFAYTYRKYMEYQRRVAEDLIGYLGTQGIRFSGANILRETSEYKLEAQKDDRYDPEEERVLQALFDVYIGNQVLIPEEVHIDKNDIATVGDVILVLIDSMKESYADCIAAQILGIPMEDFILSLIYETWDIELAFPRTKLETFRFGSEMKMLYGVEGRLTLQEREKIEEKMKYWKTQGFKYCRKEDYSACLCDRIDEILWEYQEEFDEGCKVELEGYLNACMKIFRTNKFDEIKEISRLSNMQSPQEMYLLLDKMNDLWRQMALEKREL